MRIFNSASQTHFHSGMTVGGRNQDEKENYFNGKIATLEAYQKDLLENNVESFRITDYDISPPIPSLLRNVLYKAHRVEQDFHSSLTTNAVVSGGASDDNDNGQF